MSGVSPSFSSVLSALSYLFVCSMFQIGKVAISVLTVGHESLNSICRKDWYGITQLHILPVLILTIAQCVLSRLCINMFPP